MGGTLRTFDGCFFSYLTRPSQSPSERAAPKLRLDNALVNLLVDYGYI